MGYQISKFDLDKLGRHSEIFPGFAFQSERFTDNPSDVALVKGENVQQGFIDWSASKYWPANDADLYSKFELCVSDVVLAMDRPWVTAGLKWAYIKKHDPKALLVQRVSRLRAKNRLDQTYLRCVISSRYFSDCIQPIVTGVNVPHISGKQIGDFKVPLPPTPIQRKIAAILSAYDDLIENNRRRIALLEKLAEEIYREWFVRLRFPGHEKIKKVKGVPQGWTQTPSNKVFCVMSGGTPSTDNPAYWDGEIPFFTPKDVGENFYTLTTERNITQKGLDSCNSRLYEKNTIFITARGTVGKLCLAYQKMAMNQTCYALAPVDGGKVYFHFLSMKNAITYVKGISKSGVFDNIIVDTFKIIPIFMPPAPFIVNFNELTSPLFNQIGVLLEQNAMLATTRDKLLPRLISGKLSVENLDIQFPPGMAAESNSPPAK